MFRDTSTRLPPRARRGDARFPLCERRSNLFCNSTKEITKNNRRRRHERTSSSKNQGNVRVRARIAYMFGMRVARDGRARRVATNRTVRIAATCLDDARPSSRAVSRPKLDEFVIRVDSRTARGDASPSVSSRETRARISRETSRDARVLDAETGPRDRGAARRTSRAATRPTTVLGRAESGRRRATPSSAGGLAARRRSTRGAAAVKVRRSRRERDGARAIRAELDGRRDAARRKSGARGDAALAWAARRRGRTLAGEWRHLRAHGVEAR